MDIVNAGQCHKVHRLKREAHQFEDRHVLPCTFTLLREAPLGVVRVATVPLQKTLGGVVQCRI